jgi:hypothetical protein
MSHDKKEKMIMARQILIPFNSNLRMKETLSVIEEAAQPGMRVVFLFRYPLDRWAWMRDHYIKTTSLKTAMLAGKKVMEKYSWEGQRALAEEKVAPWRYALEKIGVKTDVDLYTGALSSAVENYSRGDDIALVNRPKEDLPIKGFFYRAIAFFGLLSFRPLFFSRSNH